MKKYLDLKGFLKFINDLKEGVYTEVYTEDLEGEETKFIFYKTIFNSYTIVLYDHPYGMVGVLQDTPAGPLGDYAEELFEDMECEGEFKVFIKE